MMDASESPEFVTQYLVQQSPIPRITRHLLFYAALHEQADELCLETRHDGTLLVQHKIHGIFEAVSRFPVHLHAPIIAHFRYLAGVEADATHEQVGEFAIREGGRNLRGKIVFTFTEYGEQVSATFTS